MRQWGERSSKVLDELDERLQYYMDRALTECADISLLCGHRKQKEQNEKFYSKPQLTKVQWPNSKHNSLPSMAVDFQPYPMPDRPEKLWASLAYVAGYVIAIAKEEGDTIRWGGDWDRDGDLTDQNFDDLFHLEIVDDES